MASTGEVGCIGEDYYDALLKSMISVGYTIPEKNILISAGPVETKASLLDAVKQLQENGYKIFATKGTQEFLDKNNIKATHLHWPDEERKPNTLDFIKEKKIDLVINIPKNLSATELNNDYLIRRGAIDFNIPLITNARLAKAFIYAFCKFKIEGLTIKSWDEYV